MKQVLVSRRKGRLLGATVGGLIFGPLGAALGLGLGTRTETTIEERRSYIERAHDRQLQREVAQAAKLQRRQELISRGKNPDLGRIIFWGIVGCLFGLPFVIGAVIAIGQFIGRALGI